MKFTAAYYSAENRLIDISELNADCEHNSKNFYIKYKNNLYCDKCHKARLTYVQSKTHYLKAIHISEHSPDCICTVNQDIEFINNYFKENSDHKNIEQRLEGIIRRYLEKLTLTDTDPSIIDFDTIKDDDKARIKKPKNQKQLVRTQSLYSLNDIDETWSEYRFFYGEVYLTAKEEKTNEDNTFIALKMFNKNNKQCLCSVAMPTVVFHYLKNKCNIEFKDKITSSSLTYNVAFASRMKTTFKDNNVYFSANIHHSDYIVINKKL